MKKPNKSILKQATIYLLILFSSASFLLVGCKKDDNKIRLYEVTHSIFYAPLYVAINNGYFTDEGLTIELTDAKGSQNVMNALTARNPSADIGLHGPEASVYVNVRGKTDYPIIFSQLTKRDGSFLLSKDPTEKDSFEWNNLIGKQVLAGRKGGMPAMTFQWVIEKVAELTLTQLDFNTDVEFASMGAEFRSNADVSYTTLFEPTASEFELNGFGYIVASIGMDSGEVPYTAFSANKSYIEKNPDRIKKFIRAVVRGYNYLQTASLEDAALALQPSFSTTSIEIIQNVIKNYKEYDAWANTPVMSQSSFNTLQDIMINAGELTAEEKQDYTKIVNTEYATEIYNELKA